MRICTAGDPGILNDANRVLASAHSLPSSLFSTLAIVRGKIQICFFGIAGSAAPKTSPPNGSASGRGDNSQILSHVD